jgi:histidine triad (HIT) family protein
MRPEVASIDTVVPRDSRTALAIRAARAVLCLRGATTEAMPLSDDGCMTRSVDTYDGDDFYCDVALPDTAALEVVHDSDHVLAFHHTRPFWPVHIVVVPKRHVPSLIETEGADDRLARDLLAAVQEIAAGVMATHGAARVLTNLGSYQDSKHLHIHVSSGEPLR